MLHDTRRTVLMGIVVFDTSSLLGFARYEVQSDLGYGFPSTVKDQRMTAAFHFDDFCVVFVFLL